MSAKTFLWRHRVTYAECTLGNHIYYARYLDLLEAARGEFFRELGAPLAELQLEDMIFPVVECHLRYLAPARYDDELVVEVRLVSLSRLRMSFDYQVFKSGGAPVVGARTAHICAGCNEKPKRMHPDLAEKLCAQLVHQDEVA